MASRFARPSFANPGPTTIVQHVLNCGAVIRHRVVLIRILFVIATSAIAPASAATAFTTCTVTSVITGEVRGIVLFENKGREWTVPGERPLRS